MHRSCIFHNLHGAQILALIKKSFQEHEVSADAHIVTGSLWVGRYRVLKDGRLIRIRFNAVMRETAVAASKAALVIGILFVDERQMLENRLRVALDSQQAHQSTS